MRTNKHLLKLPRRNSRLPLHEWQRLELENKRRDTETQAARAENILMKRLVTRVGLQAAGLLSLALLTGCVVVHNAPAPSTPSATNTPPRINRSALAAPMPPMPLKVVKMTPPPTFAARFTCLNVSLSMSNKEIRDERGIGTGQWDSERRYVVTLQPLPDGTNGIVTWGAYRDGVIKLVTTSEAFHQGETYELSSAP